MTKQKSSEVPSNNQFFKVTSANKQPTSFIVDYFKIGTEDPVESETNSTSKKDKQ